MNSSPAQDFRLNAQHTIELGKLACELMTRQWKLSNLVNSLKFKEVLRNNSYANHGDYSRKTPIVELTVCFSGNFAMNNFHYRRFVC